MANLTEDEAKAAWKHEQEVQAAALRMLREGGDFAVERVILGALQELRILRENLAATQARSTQLIDESRALRRNMLVVADALVEHFTREFDVGGLELNNLERIVAYARAAAKVPPCT